MAQTDILKVDSIAALRSVKSTGFEDRYQANVLGYTTVGDGGEGVFYFDAADTASPDDGGTVIVAGDGARWKRIWSGPAHVDWFGSTDSHAIEKANALSYGVVFGPGPYTITKTLVLADKGVPNADQEAPGSTWFFNSTTLQAGGELGTKDPEPMIEVGLNTTTVGMLVIDGKLPDGHCHITGIRFAFQGEDSLGPSYNNKIDSLLVHGCSRGIHFASDGESGSYFNHVDNARVRFCTTGVLFQTSSGALNKVNANSFGNLSVSDCKCGVELNKASANQFGHLTVEGCSIMNLSLEGVRGVYIAGGFLENKGDAEGILEIDNSGIGGQVKVTVSTLKRKKGEVVRITGTGTALDNQTFTVGNVTDTQDNKSYELNTITIVSATKGNAYRHPGRNLELGADVDGVYMGGTITQAGDIKGYTYEGTRSIELRTQSRAYRLGRSNFERLEIGAGRAPSALPNADHDLAILDRLRVSGGMYCYRHSPGFPHFAFTLPTVPGAAEQPGYLWRNNGNNVLATLDDGGLSVESGALTLGSGTDRVSISLGEDAPTGAPSGALRSLYIRTDGGPGSTLYCWDGSSWTSI